MTGSEPRRSPGDPPVGAEASAGHDVFVSYSRTDGDYVRRLQEGLAARGQRAWVDWQDIPPTAEWMAEIRSAIDSCNAYVVVLSPDSMSSKVCSAELRHATDSHKRIVPLLYRVVDQDRIPEDVSKLNWIDVSDPDRFDEALDRLVSALETDLERVKSHTRLLVRTHEWESAGKDRAHLLRGSDLKGAEVFVSSDAEPRPTQAQTRFVLASSKASARRQRGAAALATSAFLVASSLGAVAWVQRAKAVRQAAIANSRAVAVQALSSMDEQPALGALLSLEADRIAPTQESAKAIRVAAQRAIWTERVIRAHQGAVNSIAFAPDGHTLASGGADGAVALWDTGTGERVALAPGQDQGPVSSVSFSTDGAMLASGGGDGTVILRDPRTGAPLQDPLRGPTGGVNSIAFGAGDRILAAGTSDGAIWLWDTHTGRAIRGPIRGEDGSIDHVTVGPGGRTLAWTSGDGISLWDLTTVRPIGSRLQTPQKVGALAFSPDGAALATGGLDEQVTFWDPARGRRIGDPISVPAAVVSMTFSPDGGILAVGTRDGAVTLWDRDNGAAIGGPLEGQEGIPWEVAFAPDGERLAAAGDTGGIPLWRPVGLHDDGADGVFLDAAFSPDGAIVASPLDDELVLWDLRGRIATRGRLPDQRVFPWKVAFGPKGELASGNSNGTTMLWDPVTPAPTAADLPAHQGGPIAVAYSSTGLIATGANDRIVSLWDAATGEPLGEPLIGHTGPVYDLAFSPDGSVLASSSTDGSIVLWDPATGQALGHPLTTSEPDAEIWSVAFSPDGRTVAGGSRGGSITLWSVQTGERIGAPLHGHTSAIPSLAFSPDAAVLASGSLDETVRLWDVAHGSLIGEPLPGYGVPWGVTFSPDGTTLVSSGSNGTLYVRDRSAWQDAPALHDRLCTVAGRNLTRAEWEAFLAFEPYRPTCARFSSDAE